MNDITTPPPHHQETIRILLLQHPAVCLLPSRNLILKWTYLLHLGSPSGESRLRVFSELIYLALTASSLFDLNTNTRSKASKRHTLTASTGAQRANFAGFCYTLIKTICRMRFTCTTIYFHSYRQRALLVKAICFNRKMNELHLYRHSYRQYASITKKCASLVQRI